VAGKGTCVFPETAILARKRRGKEHRRKEHESLRHLKGLELEWSD